MNNLNEWIPHLQHPLVLAGFGLFVFALIIRLLFLNSKKLTGPVLVPLLNKAMILLFVLAVLVVIAGFALSWKATPAAAPKSAEKPVAAKGIEQHEKRLQILEQLVLAKQAGIAPGDEKGRHKVEQELKAVQAKLADVKKSWEEEQKLHQETKADLAQLKGLLPDEQLKKAEKSLAQGDKEEAEQAFDAVAEKDGKVVALAAHRSGKLAEDRVDYEKAMRMYRTAVLLEKDNPDYLLAAGNMARTLGDYAQAQEWLERLLELREKEGKGDVDLALAQYELGWLYDDQGRYDKPEPLYKRSLEIREQKLGKDHTDVAESLNNLAALYYSQGRYKEAEPLYRRDLEITEKALGKDHPYVATTLNNLAGLYYAQGKYAEAEPLYQRAIAIMKVKFPGGHPNLYTFEENYAALKEKMAGQ